MNRNIIIFFEKTEERKKTNKKMFFFKKKKKQRSRPLFKSFWLYCDKVKKEIEKERKSNL